MRYSRRLSATAILAMAMFCQAVAGGDGGKAAKVRVALVGTGADARAQHIRDLAEVQLSADGQLQLLERPNVERLLAEQHLSLAGLLDASQAVKVGHVLSADMLAIVESAPKSQGAGFVIFDPIA